MKGHFRSVDYNNPLPPTSLPRGHGGVAIVWKPELDSFCRKLEDGNQRVIACSLDIGERPICIISAYFPSGSTLAVRNEHADTQNIITSIMDKYADTHSFVIGTDLNHDLFNRKHQGRENIIQFLQTANLTALSDGRQPTMISTCGRYESCLDYILTDNLSLIENAFNTATVLEKATDNSSAHTAITIALNIPVASHKSVNRKTQNKDCQMFRKPNWENIDKELYQQKVKQNLAYIINFTLLPTDSAARLLETCMTDAANSLQPPKRSAKHRAKKHKPWSKDLSRAFAKAKFIHHAWKEIGRPDKKHPLSMLRKKSSRAVRSAHRKHQAQKRENLYSSISRAHARDNKTFHLLINRQRAAPKQQTDRLVVEGKDITDPEEQTEAWRQHFSSLAQPQHKEGFTEELLDRATKDMDLISICLEDIVPSPESITPEATEIAIKTLNSGKAADNHGVTAEHLKYAQKIVSPVLAGILSKMAENKAIPTDLKEGRKIPIPKKGKDPKERNNARGISITSVVGKVLETTIINKSPLPPHQHPLQIGFTRDRSPGMGSLCVTEAMGESVTSKRPLYIISLDAMKAFDVVSHPILMRKLFIDKVPRDTIALIKDLYTGARETVIWKGQLSKQYPIEQGVRQGGILSTHLYKVYIDGLLQLIKQSGYGLHIGTGHFGVSACADDVILLAESEDDAQKLLDLAADYAAAHQYVLHPQKSNVLACLADPPTDIKMGTENLPPTKKLVHLGLERNLEKPNAAMTTCVQDRVKQGRRTAYSLMSVGLYSESGLNPAASVKILETYVTPRMIYGLEAVQLKNKDLDSLDQFHRQLLRDMQGLPRSTANEAVYLLSGTLPLHAELDARKLTLAGSIAREDDDNPLKLLAERQYAMGGKNSWFAEALKIAEQYMVPLEAYSQEPWGREQWKRLTRRSVNAMTFCNLLKNAAAKSSLKYIRPELLTQGSPHPIWKYTRNNTKNIRAAAVRVKLLTGTYPLQRHMRRTKQEDSASCKLCGEADESMQHFLLFCPTTEVTRRTWIQNLIEILNSVGCDIPTTPAQWCRLILNGVPERVVSSHSPQFRNSCGASLASSDGVVLGSSRIRAREPREIEIETERVLNHSARKCITCLAGLCRGKCEGMCTCGQCFNLYQRLGHTSNNLCYQLHSKRSDLLGLLAVQGAPKRQEEPP